MGFLSFLRRVFRRPERQPPQAEVSEGPPPPEISETTPAPVEETKAPPPPPSKRVSIGFDFGTNTCKVVYPLAGGNVARVLDFGHGVEDIPAFCYPTAMACEGDSVYWGPKAHSKAATGALILRSLKSCVTCHATGQSECVRGREDCIYRPTVAEFGSNPDAMTPPVAAAVFVGQALLLAKWQILKEIEQPSAVWMVNMCVPTCKLEDTDVIECYEHVLHAGNRIADMMLAGRDPSLAPDFVQRLLDEELPDPAAKMTKVVSESLASAKAYVTSLAFRPVIHAFVDIGAGTTDIAFFFYNETQQTMHWWSSATVPVAGDTIDNVLLHKAIGEHPDLQHTHHIALLEMVRHAKEAWTENTALRVCSDGSEFLLPWASAWPSAHKVYEGLTNRFRDTWREAFRHSKTMRDWQEIKVLVGGGGSAMPRLKSSFLGPVFDGLPRWELEEIHSPRDLDLAGVAEESEFHRVAVAYGLSIPWPQQPEERFVTTIPETATTRAPAFKFFWEDAPG